MAELPDGTDDFANAAATIGSLAVGARGTFANTLIAAPTIGRVLLGQVTTANGGSLHTDGDSTLLTLTAVGNTIVKVDTATKAATPQDAAEFFTAWNDTFGDEPRNAVVTGTTPDGDIQLVLTLTDATLSEIGYVTEFTAEVVSGRDEVRDLTDVTLVIDAD